MGWSLLARTASPTFRYMHVAHACNRKPVCNWERTPQVASSPFGNLAPGSKMPTDRYLQMSRISHGDRWPNLNPIRSQTKHKGCIELRRRYCQPSELIRLGGIWNNPRAGACFPRTCQLCQTVRVGICPTRLRRFILHHHTLLSFQIRPQ